MNGSTVKITSGKYAFLNQWGSARYNTATQFVATVYDKHHGDKASKYSEWAKSQMNYLLGNNPLNRNYIVGYNSVSAKYPHHRASSGFSRCEETGPQKYVLYGALVGGPDGSDQHIDSTADYIYNEVTIDYNSAFVGACAGLYRYFGDSSMKTVTNLPVKAKYYETTPEVTTGDLNMDKSIDALDLAAMKMHLLGSKPLTGDALKAADMNSDGSVDAIDFAKLKMYMLSL